MAELNFDKRRAERGVTGGHTLTVAGETYELPAVLSMAALSKVGTAIAEVTGGDLKMVAEDKAAMMAAAPVLVDVMAGELGDFVRKLDPDEFMALFELYGIGGSGEASAS